MEAKHTPMVGHEAGPLRQGALTDAAWTIVAPDGRQWHGESPLRACAAAQRDTTDPVVAMQRINALVDEENAIRDAELEAAREEGRQEARDATLGADIDTLVNRFLGWRLPQDFCPDCGISFDGRKDDEWNRNKTWPIGTNLFTAEQAKQMLLYVKTGAA